jgi:acyl-CoA thioesterase FadM
MPRNDLNLPERLSFATRLTVRITDINYGNHVGNDAVLGLLHEARLRFFADFGWSETDLDGVALIMREARVLFLSQMVYGQDLEVSVGVLVQGRTGFDLGYRIADAGSRQGLVEARTAMVCFDYAKGRPVRLPTGAARRFATG